MAPSQHHGLYQAVQCLGNLSGSVSQHSELSANIASFLL